MIYGGGARFQAIIKAVWSHIRILLNSEKSRSLYSHCPTLFCFPGAVLPLHIFEDRYRTMTADALAGDRLIAMASAPSRLGEELSPQKPAIDPVVCVGTDLPVGNSSSDGRFNFLLHGETRAQILDE